jgi:FtsZ-interacting cell division protein ZipA
MRDEDEVMQASHSSVLAQREAITRPQQGQGSIQGVMSNHSDPYLEERFALSDPITPRHVVHSGRDHSAHHISDAHLPEMPFDAARHQHSGYGRQEIRQGYGGYPEHQAHHDHHQYHDPHMQYHSQQHENHVQHHDYDAYDSPPMEHSLPAQIFALLVIDPIRSFSRHDIHNAMLGAGLIFSSNGVYVFSDKQGYPIFRVANVNEPGYFPDLDDNPDEFSTVGVALVLELPAAVTPYRAMNDFITAARRISQSLGGNLYDAQRRLIKESHLREMREYAQSIT